MGKLTSSIPLGFAALLFLFAVSVALDFEYDIASIKGGGEVLGQTSVMVGDTLHKVYEVPIPIKLLDVVTLILAVLVISRLKPLISGIKSGSGSNSRQWFLGTAGLYFLWASVSILVNAHDYTGSQLVVMGLHLLKLMQVILAGVMMSLLIRERDVCEISGPLLLGFLLASVVLILNKSGWIVIGSVAGDRMETFGSIIIAIAIIYHFHRVEVREGRITLLKQVLYVAVVFFASVAILTSGKRGVEFAYLACVVLLLINAITSSMKHSRNLHYALLAGLLVSLPNIVTDIHRTLGQPYNALHGTVYRADIANLYEKLRNIGLYRPFAADQEQPYWLSEEYVVPFVSALDYSGADRIGKIIKTINLSVENLWFGSGFWGVQYKYEFLPDTGLQVILETGLIGAALLLLMLYWIWRGFAKSQRYANRPVALHSLVVLVSLATLSVFCNPFYMSRLVMILMFFAFLCIHPRVRASEID